LTQMIVRFGQKRALNTRPLAPWPISRRMITLFDVRIEVECARGSVTSEMNGKRVIPGAVVETRGVGGHVVVEVFQVLCECEGRENAPAGAYAGTSPCPVSLYWKGRRGEVGCALKPSRRTHQFPHEGPYVLGLHADALEERLACDSAQRRLRFDVLGAEIGGVTRDGIRMEL
jgi:hypothetical protein